MKAFFRFRAWKAARAQEEIRAFWERRGVAFVPVGPSQARASMEASTSSSETPKDLATAREYAALLAAKASDEELLEWTTRQEECGLVVLCGL